MEEIARHNHETGAIADWNTARTDYFCVQAALASIVFVNRFSIRRQRVAMDVSGFDQLAYDGRYAAGPMILFA
jgi:hypothetical protein